eukprot:m.57887 g.57887  ORF g.57887 m.57887 type:complete len:129 (+) comp9380_c0_seq1:511-897(+)
MTKHLVSTSRFSDVLTGRLNGLFVHTAVSSVESCATNCISACGSLVAANIVSCVGKYSTNSFLKSKTCDCTSCTDGVSTYSQCTNQLCDQSDNTSLIIVAVVCAVVCLVCCVGCCIFCKKKSTPTSIA